VKMPFTTNKEFSKGCATPEKVLQAIRLAGRKYLPRMKYVMVQAQMDNRKEYKLVFIGGKFAWIAQINQTATHSTAFSNAPHTVLKHWAGVALKALKTSCPEAICDGLVRVDVFQSNNKLGFKVNEFESFEADVDCTDFNVTSSGLLTLRDYYILKIQQALQL